jgi:isopentenyl-diphosphate Delta-isomerase
MDITQVILVDEKDNPVGTAEKMQAHMEGLLHRAFSIFIINDNGEMLLQQRALKKYHSGGLWTNACCSHPAPGEDTAAAAIRRLKEEMGFAVPIKKLFDFVYQASFDNGLTEYEFDHVFVGTYTGKINFNTSEVMDFCYKSIQDVKQSLESHPQKYTAWFHLAFPKIEQWWNEQLKEEIV